jgi:hypothetical protein
MSEVFAFVLLNSQACFCAIGALLKMLGYNRIRLKGCFRNPVYVARMERTHGGNERRGKRKILRPLCDKRPMHLVIKCRRPIYSERKFVDQTLEATARKFSMPVYDYAVALDHIRFVSKVPSRAAYSKFIRALCRLLAKKFGKKYFQLDFHQDRRLGPRLLQPGRVLQKEPR